MTDLHIWLKIKNLRVFIQDKEILQDISLEMVEGEQWALFGAAGSGKTLLAHTLAGGHAFQGLIEYPQRMDLPFEKNTRVIDQQHRFRDLQNQSNFYYQQRYNSSDAALTITVRDDLAGFDEQENGFLSKSELLRAFHLEALLDEPLIQLSNGENKRIQILKTLLHFPYLLIFDEPFTGLDAAGRLLLEDILQKISAWGRHMIWMSSRNYLPPGFNRRAGLQHGKLFFDEESLEKNRSAPAPAVLSSIRDFPTTITFQYPDFQYAVRMNQVQVRYDGKTILKDIDWEVKKGSRWALTGPNGAGKSTLLSLITADNPQAYANDLYLFDRKRGSGESIWEIKAKTGFLSPELQLYFDPSATAFTALASGLFDSIGLFRSLSEVQDQLVWEWLDFLDCRIYAGKRLSGLAAGVQRMILLGRALIKTPPLLILDEPCQGLDLPQREFSKQLIDRYCALFQATLIYVSHYPEDFPPSIQHILQLDRGIIV
jgi:molybdate transport system ATP-binding protein